MSDRVEWPTERDKEAALIIRTDYGDEPAWAAVKAALMMTWGEDEDFEPYVHIVDDPQWTGITPAEVLSQAAAHSEPAVSSTSPTTSRCGSPLSHCSRCPC
ncbi:DUF6924 domain-containing protein [Streptomyces sp. NPDC060035]|uniref:DUF6924 domain-containing protein n=1 Tax=Streptomyces sp. NPDC060035 TaxID=3347044 RepID=UPI003687896B